MTPGEICGYIRRQMFLASLSQNNYSRELLLRQEMRVAGLMDPRPICLDAYTNLSEASDILMKRDDSVRFDPFIVLLENKYYGISSVRRVLDSVNYYFNLDLKACQEAQERLMVKREGNTENLLHAHKVVHPSQRAGRRLRQRIRNQRVDFGGGPL